MYYMRVVASSMVVVGYWFAYMVVMTVVVSVVVGMICRIVRKLTCRSCVDRGAQKIGL